MIPLVTKLEKVAAAIERLKGLDFLGLVHRVEAPDRWDLLVLSPGLEPRSLEAMRYVAGELARALTTPEIVSIARIVVLAPDDNLPTWLSGDERIPRGRQAPLQDERFDRVLLIRPLRHAEAVARA